MSDAIKRLKETIARAKQGDVESIVSLRNVLSTVAEDAPRDDLIRLAEALCEVRDESARAQLRMN